MVSSPRKGTAYSIKQTKRQEASTRRMQSWEEAKEELTTYRGTRKQDGKMRWVQNGGFGGRQDKVGKGRPSALERDEGSRELAASREEEKKRSPVSATSRTRALVPPHACIRSATATTQHACPVGWPSIAPGLPNLRAIAKCTVQTGHSPSRVCL